MDIIAEIEKKYDIKIFIEQDDKILTDEIIIGKIGKLSNVNGIYQI
jgi:acyl carrier protein